MHSEIAHSSFSIIKVHFLNHKLLIFNCLPADIKKVGKIKVFRLKYEMSEMGIQLDSNVIIQIAFSTNSFSY